MCTMESVDPLADIQRLVQPTQQQRLEALNRKLRLAVEEQIAGGEASQAAAEILLANMQAVVARSQGLPI